MTSTEYLHLIRALVDAHRASDSATTRKETAKSVRTLVKQGRAALRNEYEGLNRIFDSATASLANTHGATTHDAATNGGSEHNHADHRAPTLNTRRHGVTTGRRNARRSSTSRWFKRAASAVLAPLRTLGLY